jgi:type IV pilus assembly protein PilB
MIKKRERLGDILIREGAITSDQLNSALFIQREKRKRLGEVLVEMGFITEDKLTSILSAQLKIPRVDLKKVDLQVFEKKLNPIIYRKRVLPLFQQNNYIVLAMCDPLDVITMDDVARITGCKVRPVIAKSSDMDDAIARYKQKETEREIEEMGDERTKRFMKEIGKERMVPFKLDSSIFLEATKSTLSQSVSKATSYDEEAIEKVLVEAGIVTKDQLRLAKNKRGNEKLGDTLVRLRFTTRATVLSKLSHMLFS